MSALSDLIIISLILSVVGIVLFYLYYNYSSRRDSLEELAESSGYEDRTSYVRDTLAGKTRMLSWSIFLFNDAKSIGLRFIFTSLLFFFIAGTFGVLMRVSLTDPNPTIITPIQYNVLLTQHGTLMIYMWALGSALGLGYYLLPSLLRVKRDIMGGYSSFAYWIYTIGGFLMVLSRSSTRWYFYPPLSLQLQPFGAGVGNWLAVIALELIFIGATMASIIVLRIIFIDRADDMPLSKMPLFAWSIVFTLIMLVSSAPPLMVGLGMLFYDFFNPIFFTASSQNVLLFTILFWFWGHPIVYIAVLPAFGLMYEIIPKFTGAKVFSYTSGVAALGLLMILSEVVWGHHLFNSGLGLIWDLFFSTASFAVVIPSAITVFNYIATLWNSPRIRMTTPMLFVINGILDFIIGGIIGVMQSNVGVNEVVHGTYLITGHFHFIFLGVTTGIAFAAFYMLFPTFSGGRVYNERLAKWHFYLTAFGSFLMSIAWTIGGFIGMPRAVAGYFAVFQPFQDTAIIGGVILGIGQLVFLYNLAVSWLKAPSTDITNALESPTEVVSSSAGGR